MKCEILSQKNIVKILQKWEDFLLTFLFNILEFFSIKEKLFSFFKNTYKES